MILYFFNYQHTPTGWKDVESEILYSFHLNTSKKKKIPTYLPHSLSSIVTFTGLEQSRQRKMSRNDGGSLFLQSKGGGFDRSIANGTRKVARVTFYWVNSVYLYTRAIRRLGKRRDPWAIRRRVVGKNTNNFNGYTAKCKESNKSVHESQAL